MRMIRFFLIAAILSVPGSSVLADGTMFIPRITYNITGYENVSSSAQKALLIWRDDTEILHLQSNYEGPVSDFAWVVPVPDRPSVERSDWVLFEQAEEMTRPKVKVLRKELFGGVKCGCSAQDTMTEETLDTSVTELETLQIRELNIVIVSAGDSDGFISWLEKNDYAIPSNARDVLQHYIEKNFYFIVVKVNKSSEWAQKEGLTETISGGLTPIAVSFKTPAPFYPLEISSISSTPENELLLLCITGDNIVPVEYECDRLQHEDVRDTIGPSIYHSKNLFKTKADFSPAVKAAQQRLPGPSLIIEHIAPAAWSSDEQQRIVRKKQNDGDINLRVTRFHSFIKPADMKDITFESLEDESLFEGFFYIEDTSGFVKNLAVSYCPVFFAGILWFIPKRNLRQKKMLRTLSIGLLLFAIMI